MAVREAAASLGRHPVRAAPISGAIDDITEIVRLVTAFFPSDPGGTRSVQGEKT
jgi:hypothetical protein